MFTQDFTGIGESLNNLVLAGQDMTEPVEVMNVLQMAHTVLQNHRVNMRPRDLVLVAEGIAQLTRYVCRNWRMYSGTSL